MSIFPYPNHAAALSSINTLMLSLQKQNILAPAENRSKHCLVDLEEAKYLAANALGLDQWDVVSKKIDAGCPVVYLDSFQNMDEIIDEMAQRVVAIISNIDDEITKSRVIVALKESAFACCPPAQYGAKSNFKDAVDESAGLINYDNGYVVEVRYQSARDIFEIETTRWETAVKFAEKNGLPVPKKPSRPIRFKNPI